MSSETKKILSIILLSFVIRILLIDTATVEGDMRFWTVWSEKLANGGFANFYINQGGGLQTDYLPGYMYILLFLGKIKIILENWGVILSDHLLFKLPAILADLGAVAIIYRIVRKYFSGDAAIKAAVLYAFNPAIFANSAMWGQVDGFQAYFLLLTLWLFIENNLYLASASLAYAVLIKPISIFILPVILFIIFFRLSKIKNQFGRFEIKRFIKNFWEVKEYREVLFSLFVFFIVIFALVMPFAGNKAPWNFIFERFTASIDQYKLASFNAFNYWALSGIMWRSDSIVQWGITLKQWGLVMFSFVSVFAVCFLYKYRNSGRNFLNIILASAIIFVGAFDLLTRAHERHLLIALPFLAILAIASRKFLIAYTVTSITYFINLYFSYKGGWAFFEKDTVNLLSAINIIILIFLMLEISLFGNEQNHKLKNNQVGEQV